MGHITENHVCISSQVLSQEITSIVGGTKVDVKLRECIKILGTAHESLGETEPIEVRSSLVNTFSHITPKEMAEFQQADNQISAVYPWVQEGKTPPKSVLYKTRSKIMRKLFHQFERLTLKKEVLHRLYIHEDMEYHQLVLPQRFHSKILWSIHDDMGHQGLKKPWNSFEKGSIGLPWLQMHVTGLPNVATVRWPKEITPHLDLKSVIRNPTIQWIYFVWI